MAPGRLQLYWTRLSWHRVRAGRKCVSVELRELIFRMVADIPTWGSPRIHGELKMLGFDISERTVLRWMRKAPRNSDPAKRWAAFLSNHREAIAAMDFFTVPTLTFGVLYCFFIIAHDRRRILHCNVTRHPRSAWVIQQLREAFPTTRRPDAAFRGGAQPVFFTRSGEQSSPVSRWIAATLKVTEGVCCVACKHCHLLEACGAAVNQNAIGVPA
jgi:hypothetical protein